MALGGYEVECAGVVERLRENHTVLVLTSDLQRRKVDASPLVRRELKFLTHNKRGAVAAPFASVRAVGRGRRARARKPQHK